MSKETQEIKNQLLELITRVEQLEKKEDFDPVGKFFKILCKGVENGKVAECTKVLKGGRYFFDNLIFHYTPDEVEEVPAPKFEFVVGKWYEFIEIGLYAMYHGLDNNFGFVDKLTIPSRRNNIRMKDPNKWKLADMKKIENLFIQNAVYHGYVTGTKFKCLASDKIMILDCLIFDSKYNQLRSTKGIISDKGKWADIITNELSIGDHPVNFITIHNEIQVEINKRYYTLQEFEAALKVLRAGAVIKVGCHNQIDLDIDFVKEIIERIHMQGNFQILKI